MGTTQYRFSRSQKTGPKFDWDAFLREAAGRVLERDDLPDCVREAADSGAAAALDYGYSIKTPPRTPKPKDNL